ncbi:MAG: DsbA family protein [Candidatus Binataceae bacterium]
MAEILASIGLPAEALIARANAPENKERLRSQTERASRLGIFGAPTFHVDEEIFWGNDRLEDAFAFYQQDTARK